MAHWLIKSEPSVYGWAQFVKEKKTSWTGVRNAQASINLKAMKVGDRCFFYHSNEGKEIVGIAEVVKAAYLDPTDKAGKAVTVDVKALEPVKTPGFPPAITLRSRSRFAASWRRESLQSRIHRRASGCDSR